MTRDTASRFRSPTRNIAYSIFIAHFGSIKIGLSPVFVHLVICFTVVRGEFPPASGMLHERFKAKLERGAGETEDVIPFGRANKT